MGFVPFVLKITPCQSLSRLPVALTDAPLKGKGSKPLTIRERQVLMVVAVDGRLYLLPEPRPAKYERVDITGLHEAAYGPDNFE
jgi:hypothetical protein